MELRTLWPRLTAEQREQLASAADTSEGYLRQLACGWVRPSRGRKVRPSLELITKLAAADGRLKLADLVREFS